MIEVMDEGDVKLHPGLLGGITAAAMVVPL